MIAVAGRTIIPELDEIEPGTLGRGLDIIARVRLAMSIHKRELERTQARRRERGVVMKGRRLVDTIQDYKDAVPAVGDTRDRIGRALGWSGMKYYRARNVLMLYDENPARWQPFVDELAKTGRVSEIHEAMRKARLGIKDVPKPRKGRRPQRHVPRHRSAPRSEGAARAMMRQTHSVWLRKALELTTRDPLEQARTLDRSDIRVASNVVERVKDWVERFELALQLKEDEA